MIYRETRNELLAQMTNFQQAIFFLLDGDDLSVAFIKNEMTAKQRERFERIETAYIEEQLKDCTF